MGKFTGKGKTPVTVEGDENVIYVVDKLSYGQRQRILSAMAQISADVGTKAGATPAMRFDVGAFNLAVAHEAIVGWDGPDFKDIEVTPEAINDLNFEDPLVKKAIELAGNRASSAMETTSPKPLPPVSSDGGNTSTAKTPLHLSGTAT